MLAPSQKQPLVLNTEAFETKHLRELNLDCAQWIKASRNYVSFIEEASDHFEHIEKAQENYCAILVTNVRLCTTKYISMPFHFDAFFYARKFDQAVGELRMQQLEACLGAAPSSSHSAGGREGALGGENSGTRGGCGGSSGHSVQVNGSSTAERSMRDGEMAVMQFWEDKEAEMHELKKKGRLMGVGCYLKEVIYTISSYTLIPALLYHNLEAEAHIIEERYSWQYTMYSIAHLLLASTGVPSLEDLCDFSVWIAMEILVGLTHQLHVIDCLLGV
ncbi:hypothetical protein DFH09DRAFT_1109720 [Mycena vulgaris]|nr:hypothetical protein DFH09DRAFT_1109720 [Mycena vulgaris]